MLNFSVFAKEFSYMCKAKPNITKTVNYLLDEIKLYSIDKFKNEGGIKRQRASAYYNGDEKIPGDIIEATYQKDYLDNLYIFFADAYSEKIDQSKVKISIDRLISSLKQSNGVPTEHYEKTLSLYIEGSYPQLLAELFLCAIRYGELTENKNIDLKEQKTTDLSKPIRITVDFTGETKDLDFPYVNALYDVYAEKYKKSIDCIEDCPKEKNHFTRQRQAYFDAEGVRRASRDSYKDDLPFDELKSEMYDGIIEVYECEYNTGYSRLQKVLEHASQVSFDSVILYRETRWINQSVKKGVCHILVNDGKIKGWVKKDE